ncbi:hypothetical protein Tco_0007517 [Tanacetum coccineum]
MSVPVTAKEKTNKKNDVKLTLCYYWLFPMKHHLLSVITADIETMSIDDFTSSTNDVNTAKPAYEVSTVSPNINTACPQVSTANFSDNIVYAFMVKNPNGSNLLQQDLEQIYEDDLEAMDLKWQLSLLNMRAKSCHKMGHFARECRAPRNKEDDSKENSNDSLVKEQVSEDTSSFVESSLNVDKETVLLVDKKIKPKAVNTVRPHSAVVNAVRVNQANAVKASACWVWRPTKLDSASITLRKHNYIDARGRSKHMTRNIAYLSDFKEFDGGYVTFWGGAHGGRISGKGTLKTDSLDFEDLPDESQILLKIPRKDNMYSFDIKNIVPKESLTCLVAKATSDESIL